MTFFKKNDIISTFPYKQTQKEKIKRFLFPSV